MNVINQNLALEKLKDGLPVIFQTDTLPAIGCLPKFSKIIYKTKKRNKNKPLILMGSETSQLQEFVHHSALDDYKTITSKYWPGALTVIIPISEKKKSTFIYDFSNIGIRIPNSLTAKSLINLTGPLLTSSANISGIDASTTAEDVANNLPNIDILGPVPWEKCSGEASTIISWVDHGNWKLIRKGKVLIPRIS